MTLIVSRRAGIWSIRIDPMPHAGTDSYEFLVRFVDSVAKAGCTVFVLNGGVRTLEDALEHLQLFDGVMIGREAHQNPYLLALLHRAVCDPQWTLPSREEIVERYVPYVQDRLAEGHRLRSMIRHVQGLHAGLPRVRSWRRFLSERASAPDARADVLIDAQRIVRAVAVHCVCSPFAATYLPVPPV